MARFYPPSLLEYQVLLLSIFGFVARFHPPSLLEYQALLLQFLGLWRVFTHPLYLNIKCCYCQFTRLQHAAIMQIALFHLLRQGEGLVKVSLVCLCRVSTRCGVRNEGALCVHGERQPTTSGPATSRFNIFVETGFPCASSSIFHLFKISPAPY